MTITGMGVVSRRAGEPALLEEINIEPPGPGEVLIRILASGVCHTDLLYKPESTEGGGRVSALKRQEGAPLNLG